MTESKDIFELNNIKKTRQGIIRFDSVTAKLLPVSMGRKRYNNFVANKIWKDFEIEITANESLNGYDMITLFMLIDDYQQNLSKWTKAGNIDGRPILKRTLDLKELCYIKNIKTDKNNRKTIYKAIRRWYEAEITYKFKNNTEQNSRYIFELKVDKNTYNKIEINVNQKFMDFCIKNGMTMNWKRLLNYKQNYYAMNLDIFLQFNTKPVKNKYYYKDVFLEETLFNHIGLSDDVKDIKHKREKLKRAFDEIYKKLKVKYVFVAGKGTEENKWCKESYLKYIENKSKKA